MDDCYFSDITKWEKKKQRVFSCKMGGYLQLVVKLHQCTSAFTSHKTTTSKLLHCMFHCLVVCQPIHKKLPASIGQLITLQRLDLSQCSQLKELPTSIGQLTTLQTLNLSYCSQLHCTTRVLLPNVHAVCQSLFTKPMNSLLAHWWVLFTATKMKSFKIQ